MPRKKEKWKVKILDPHKSVLSIFQGNKKKGKVKTDIYLRMMLPFWRVMLGNIGNKFLCNSFCFIPGAELSYSCLLFKSISTVWTYEWILILIM